MKALTGAVVGVAVAVAGVYSASAQEFSGTVRIVVPYAAGGTSDIISRLIAPELQKALKTNVIVENKPGANGNIGADAVAHAKKDGHTLLFCDLVALAASPAKSCASAIDVSAGRSSGRAASARCSQGRAAAASLSVADGRTL